jgi:hypothetical protein
MMRNKQCTLVLFASILFAPQIANAQTCSGNACDKIVVRQKSDCIILFNSSNYPIKVTQLGVGGWGPIDVYAGSEKSITVGDFTGVKGCLRTWERNYTAVYVGNGPPNPVPDVPRPANPSPDVRGSGQGGQSGVGRGGRFGNDNAPLPASIEVMVMNRTLRPLHVKVRYIDKDTGKWETSRWYFLESKGHELAKLNSLHGVVYGTVYDESGCATTPQQKEGSKITIDPPTEEPPYTAQFFKLNSPIRRQIGFWAGYCREEPGIIPAPSSSSGRLRRVPPVPQ